MTDVGFIVAGYGVILGGLVIYAAMLVRRLGAARLDARGQPSAEPATAPTHDGSGAGHAE